MGFPHLLVCLPQAEPSMQPSIAMQFVQRFSEVRHGQLITLAINKHVIEWVCIYIYICIYIYTYIYIYVCMCIYIHIYAQIIFRHVISYTHIRCINLHVYKSLYIIYIYIYTYAAPHTWDDAAKLLSFIKCGPGFQVRIVELKTSERIDAQ